MRKTRAEASGATRPTVERLEAVAHACFRARRRLIRLPAWQPSTICVPMGQATRFRIPSRDGSQAVSSATWDAALVQTELADILGDGRWFDRQRRLLPHPSRSEPKVAAPPVTTADTKALTSGADSVE